MIKNCAKTAEILPSIDEIKNKADSVCPVKWAVDVVELAMKNTCGKGTICRDGLKQLYLIGKDITMNKGTMEDVELLQELCVTMYLAADCELSGRAIELFKTSLELHYNEWTAHILRKKCKAGVCTAFPKAAIPGMDLLGGSSTTANRRRKPAAAVEETPAPAANRRRRGGTVVVVEEDKPAAAAAPVFDIPAEETPAAPAARPAAPVIDLPEGGRRRRREKKIEIVEE